MHNMCLQGCAKLQLNSFLPFDFFVWNQNVILNTLKCTLMKRLGEIFCKIAAAYNTQAGLIKHGIRKYSALSREQLRLLQVAAAYKRIKGHTHITSATVHPLLQKSLWSNCIGYRLLQVTKGHKYRLLPLVSD